MHARPGTARQLLREVGDCRVGRHSCEALAALRRVTMRVSRPTGFAALGGERGGIRSFVDAAEWGCGMIARLWKTELRPERVEAYELFARDVAVPVFRVRDGFRACVMCRDGQAGHAWCGVVQSLRVRSRAMRAAWPTRFVCSLLEALQNGSGYP